MTRLRTLLTVAFLALLATGPSAAQDVPDIGGAGTLDVATWNLEWYGNDDLGPPDGSQQNNVINTILNSGIDVWGLQELSGSSGGATPETVFGNLLAALGDDWDGVLTNSGNYSGNEDQRLGFVWRKAVFSETPTVRVIPDLEDDSFDFASRVPIELTGPLALPGAGAFTIRIINFHAKAGGGDNDYSRRTNGSQELKRYTDGLLADAGAEPAFLIILGDFNDNLEGSISGRSFSPYFNFVADEDNYEPFSLVLEEAVPPLYTFCGSSDDCSSGSNLDQIIVSEALVAVRADGEAARFDELLSVFGDPDNASNSDGFDNTTSDHLPVYTRFDFTMLADGEDDPLAQALNLSTYPAPFTESATVRLTLPASGAFRAEVFDVLGRRVALLADGVRAAGPHTLRLDGTGLAPGVYVLRVTTPQGTATRLLTRR